MLTREDLVRYTEVTGFNLGQVEKDYVQHVFLLNLYRRIGDEFIFKGGTALQKCYGLNRFSEDLDFTLSRGISVEEVIEKSIVGMNLFGCESSTKKMKDDDISVSFQIRVRGPLYDGREKSYTYVRVEISKRERSIFPPTKINVIPMYRDLPPYMISVMETSEIMAEKVRAILTRERARDVYDLYFLIGKGVETNLEMIEDKLRYYSMEFDTDEFVSAVERKERLWYNELRNLVPQIPDFDTVKRSIHRWIKGISSI